MAATNPTYVVPPAMPSPAPAGVATTNEIRASKPPVPIASGWEWMWWLAGGLILAGVLAGLWRRLRKIAVTLPPTPVPAHIRARQKLNAALALIHDPKAFCTAVSDAVRQYLEERFNYRAPERTTEEFLIELQSSAHLLPDQKQSLGDFLQGCDLVKFAQFEPNEDALRQWHEGALRLVDETQFEKIAPPGTLSPSPGLPPLPPLGTPAERPVAIPPQIPRAS